MWRRVSKVSKKVLSEEECNRRYTKAEEIAKRLLDDYFRASMSWMMFKSGNGWEEGDKATLREVLKDTYAAHAFNNALTEFALSTIAFIARTIDKSGNDVLSLHALKGCIGEKCVREKLAENAEQWPTHLVAEGEKQPRAGEHHQLVLQKIPELISKITSLENDMRVISIKRTRNELLSHSLPKGNNRPKYKEVDGLFSEIMNLIELTQLIIFGESWSLEAESRKHKAYADDFWNAFENGLAIREK